MKSDTRFIAFAWTALVGALCFIGSVLALFAAIAVGAFAWVPFWAVAAFIAYGITKAAFSCAKKEQRK